MFETPAKSLIKDDSGKVTGVIATKSDGGQLTIHAKSVVLGQIASATGEGRLLPGKIKEPAARADSWYNLACTTHLEWVRSPPERR